MRDRLSGAGCDPPCRQTSRAVDGLPEVIVRTMVVVVGLVVGGAIGWFVGSAEPDAAEPVAASIIPSTTTASVDPFYVEADETLVGSAALVIEEILVSEGEVVIEFGLHPVAPTLGADENAGFLRTLPPAHPDRWVLETASGEIEGSVGLPSTRTVRFPVPASTDREDIVAVRLTHVMFPVPVDDRFSLSASAGEAEIVPGVRAELRRLVVQGEQSIVQVAMVAEPTFQTGGLNVRGDGFGWLSSSREAEGGARWTLRYDGATVPEPIPLRVSGAVWVGVDVDLEVAVPGEGAS